MRIPFKLKTLFWDSRLFCGGVGTFSRACWSKRVTQTKCWNIFDIFGRKSLKFVACPVDVFSEAFLAEAAANRTHNLPLIPRLSENVCYPDISREKEVLSISVLTAEVRDNFSLVLESLSFRHAWSSLPVRCFLGNLLFEFIYSSFSFLF